MLPLMMFRRPRRSQAPDFPSGLPPPPPHPRPRPAAAAAATPAQYHRRIEVPGEILVGGTTAAAAALHTATAAAAEFNLPHLLPR